LSEGFKIGEGFVEVTTEDDTSSGLARMSAGFERWSALVSERIDNAIGDSTREATRDANADLERLKDSALRKIEAINAKRLRIDADITQAEVKLTTLQRKAETATGDERLKVDADIASAEAKLATLHARKNALRDERVNINVSIDRALAKLAVVEQKVDSVAGTRHVRVNANTGAAQAKVGAVHAALSSLSGRTANVFVNAHTGRALAKIAAVAAALSALVPLAAAALGGIAGIGIIGGAGLGAVVGGLAGIGGAVKALGEKSAGAGGAAGKAASDHLQMASAIDRVKQAQAALANTQANAASQIRRADQSVTRAEEDLAAAQGKERVALEDLNDARRDAVRYLEDLQRQTEDMALSQRSADIAVRQARQDLDRVLQDPRTTQLQRDQAQLAYDEAIQQQENLKAEAEDLAETKREADRKGVNGSDLVVEATERVAAAQDAVRDAVERVRDAELDAADARVQAAYSVASAQQSVVDAQRAVQQASMAAGAAGAGGINSIADAMARLTPAGREFALFLRGFIDGPIRQLRNALQEGLLPGLQRGLESIIPIMGQLTPAIGQFGTVLGQALGGLITELAKMAPAFLDFASGALRGLAPLQDVMAAFGQAFADMTERITANGVLEAGMRGVVALIEAILDQLPDVIELGLEMMAVLGPATGELFKALMQALLRLGEALTPVISQLMDALGPALGPLADALAAFARAVAEVLIAMLPSLTVVLEALVPVLEAFSDWVAANPELVGQLATALVALMAAFYALNPVISFVGTLAGVLAGLSSTVLWLIAGATALVGVIASGWKNSQDFRDAMTSLWGSLKQAGEVIWEQVKPALDDLWQVIQADVLPALQEFVVAIQPIVSWLVDHLAPIVAEVFGGIVSLIKSALQIISGNIDVFTGIITGDWDRVWNGMRRVLSGILGAIVGILRMQLNIMLTVARTIATAIVNAMTQMGRNALAGVRRWFNAIPGVIRAPFSRAGTWLLDAGRQIIQGLINGVDRGARELRSRLESVTRMIPDWKGPPARDAQLLRPTGRLIMGGLTAGFADEEDTVRRQLASLTASISAPAVGGGPGTAAAVQTGSSGGGVTINGGITLQLPQSASTDLLAALQSMSAADMRRFARAVRDELLNLEGAYK
jgi:phage-related protein